MTSKLTSYTLSATVGAGGTGSDTTGSPVKGKIHAIEIDYDTNTCTVDIDAAGVGTTTQKILNLSAANTDRTVYPRVQLQDNTGIALDLSDLEGGDTAVYGYFVVNGILTLSIASGTQNDVVTVRILVEEY